MAPLLFSFSETARQHHVLLTLIAACVLVPVFRSRYTTSVFGLSTQDGRLPAVRSGIQAQQLLPPARSLASKGGGSSVVRTSDSWSKGPGFESPQERLESFLLRVSFTVDAYFGIRSIPVLPQYVKDPGIPPKVQVAGYNTK